MLPDRLAYDRRPDGRPRGRGGWIDGLMPHAALSGILLYIALRMHRIDERDPHWSPLKEAAWSPAGDAKPL